MSSIYRPAMSAQGGLFQDQRYPAGGTRVEVELILPLDEMKNQADKRTLIEVPGLVVRTEKDGMAIRFDNEVKMVPLDGEES